MATLSGETRASDMERFEARIRPVLVERCYRCHNSTDRAEGGLALDHRAGMLRGGSRGPAVVPGRPEESWLVRAIRHDDGAPAMPREEPKLQPDEVSDFVDWIAAGAADPRDRPPSADELAEETSWEQVRARRAEWWSFQPIVRPEVPSVPDGWVRGDLDRFIADLLRRQGLSSSDEADHNVLLRRASVVITGIPPTIDERAAFLADESPLAYEHAVDRMLASPRFGERWARHWMDLFRYAESHGSEGDPPIRHAWRYRDAMIRAFNADVPYDRLVAEHVAGDLLDPREHPDSDLNEAALGVAQLRFVQHGYAPTDALEEQVRFIDNQIDVVSKAVLGLTVSCARCHDHKFDPISQRDYYALFGVFASARPGMRQVDLSDRLPERVELASLRDRVREGLAAAWIEASRGFSLRLLASMNLDPAPAVPVGKEAIGTIALGPMQSALAEAGGGGDVAVLGPWVAMSTASEAEFTERWEAVLAAQAESLLRVQARNAAAVRWDLGDPLVASAWFLHAPGRPTLHAPAGGFAILPDGERVADAILPAGVFTHLESSKLGAIFTSPMFEVEARSLWVRGFGGGGARARYAMQHYPRVAGPVYKSHAMDGVTPSWKQWDMTYWRGDRAYVELATGPDLPVEANDQERSWWGLTEVLALDAEAAPPEDEPSEFTTPLFRASSDSPDDLDALAVRYESALVQAITSWREGRADDADARFLSGFVRHGLLPVELSALPDELRALVDEYRERESSVSRPIRAPGPIPGPWIDQELMVRGDHRQFAEAVPQRFLEVIDPTPYARDRAGREQLADDLVGRDNPLTARVAVNRIWHHVFGRGLVKTTDNFGLLGDAPTHPELLDWLASEFVVDGWSTKKMIRRLVTSATFRHGSDPAAIESDPENRWLSHMPPRRMDAEAIRDSMLSVSGRLDRSLYGPPSSEGSARRSVYVAVRQNALSPFLTTFDAPLPFSTTGRRAVTQVPAQALALMNDPLVLDAARHWAAAILGDETLPDVPARARRMFEQGFARSIADREVASAVEFVARMDAMRQTSLAETRRLKTEIEALEGRVAELMWVARGRVLSARDPGMEAGRPDVPAPIARWEFDVDLSDSIGEMHGEPVGAPRVEGGRLHLDGESYVLTAPLKKDLTEKTLEAWVQLDGLDQSGVGVLGVQSSDGALFDTIVYAERRDAEWMAGSNHFKRTQDAGGDREVATGLVHIAVTYALDGTVALYREGAPYGKAYPSVGPHPFARGRTQALLGMRHGAPGNERGRLRGSIERAQLYDRALTAEEVAATASGDPSFVSSREALAAMTPAEVEELVGARKSLAILRDAWSSQVATGQDDADPSLPWAALAHSIFCMKEFYYLR